MNARTLKFAILGIFLSFAILGFFISGSRITAQKKQSDILEKAAAYKTWKQPVKPAPETPLEPLISTTAVTTVGISVADSSEFG